MNINVNRISQQFTQTRYEIYLYTLDILKQTLLIFIVVSLNTW